MVTNQADTNGARGRPDGRRPTKFLSTGDAKSGKFLIPRNTQGSADLFH